MSGPQTASSRVAINLIQYEIIAIVISSLTLLAVALLIPEGLLKSPG